jgi:hypothetical protein
MSTPARTMYESQRLAQKNGGPIPMSVAGIYKAIKDKKIPSITIGRRVFIPSWYVDSLLDKPN